MMIKQQSLKTLNTVDHKILQMLKEDSKIFYLVRGSTLQFFKVSFSTF